jgi:hypothetical protein
MGNQRLTQTHALAQNSQSRPVMRMSQKPQEDGLENFQGLGSNRAVNEAIAQQDSQTRSYRDSQNGNDNFRGLSSEIRAVAQPQSLVIQPKLVIGQPNDKYEQEADRVAQQVVQQLNSHKITQPTQAQTVEQYMAQGEEKLQKRLVSQNQMVEDEGADNQYIENTIKQMRGTGQQLPDLIRTRMEKSFSADFTDVKVHTSSEADKINKRANSRAFVANGEIFFRQGNFAPGTREGDWLIAHELTHVLQQKPNVGVNRMTGEPSVFGTTVIRRGITPYDASQMGGVNAAQGNSFLDKRIVYMRWTRDPIASSVKSAVNGYNDGNGGTYKHYVPWIRLFHAVWARVEGRTRGECIEVLDRIHEALGIKDTSRIEPQISQVAFDSWFEWMFEAICDYPANIYQWNPSTGDNGGKQMDEPIGCSQDLKQRLVYTAIHLRDAVGVHLGEQLESEKLIKKGDYA